MSNVQRMEAISNVKKRKYKCPFCDNRYDRVRMITHIEKKHPEYISDDYTATRIVFNLVNKKEKGTCVMCGKESPWNEEKGRYDRFCSPECIKAYTKLADRRLKDVTGKTKQELLKDPEYQNKVMLSHRSISGEYTFQDGSKKKYVGTYEKNFLRFMDVFLNIKSEDIETPGPIIDYEYKGKKHKWITDAYYAPYNLVFDIKDGGDNPNNREMPEYRAKQDAKEDAIKKLNKYNYIRLTDNKFEQLIQLMMELKELYVDNNSIYDPIIRINESSLNEACKDVETARKFVRDVGKLAKKYDANYFIVTDGASGTSNTGNPAVKHARDCHIEWEKKHGHDPYEDWSKDDKVNESTMIEDNIITEAVIFDKDDAYYNFDKFVNGQCNILFITGFSGGGKTTLTKEYSKKYKAEIIEIDNFECYMNRVKKDDGSVYSEFLYKTDFGKEYMERYMGLTDTSVNLIFQRDFTNEMMKFLLDYCGKRKNQKFIIEGMQVFRWEDYQKIKDYALIIKGTSALTSAIRRIKRNKEEMSITHILELMRWYVKDDKMMNKLHKVFDESYIIDEIDNSEDNEMIGEGYLLNKKDIYYNKDKFDSGEINLCFITGHSGSGKTTMGRYMQNEKNVETYGLDDLISNYNFSDDNLKEYGDLIYSFFKGVGKQFRYHSKKELYDDHKWDGISDDYDGYEFSIITSFVDYAIKYAKSHRNTKFVLEGVWIYIFFEPKYFEKYAIYIKGTSALISNLRGARRDSKDGKTKLETIKNRVRESLSNIKYRLIDEKDVSKFYNYFKSKMDKGINESYINEIKAKDLGPKVCKKCGSKNIGVFFKGEPIYQCKDCGAFLGVVPFKHEFRMTDNFLNEAMISDKDNMYINYDLWNRNSNHNILYITGLSGSGKSTLSRKLSKEKHAEYIELDMFTNAIIKGLDRWNDKVNKGEYTPNNIIKEYLNKVRLENNGMKSWSESDINKEHEKFLKWLIQRVSGNGILYIVEGAQLFMKLANIDPSIIKGEPTIIMGTSALTSWVRRFKRDTQNDETIGRVFYHFKKDFPMLYKYYISNEKDLQRFVKAIQESTITESSLDDNIDTLIFDFGDVLLRPDSEYIFMNYKFIPDEYKKKALKLLHKDYDLYSLGDILNYIDEEIPELSNHKNELIDLYSQIYPYDYTYDLLKTLKGRGYKLYYLSNWSKWGIEILKMQNRLSLLDLFDGGIFSYEVEMRKPDLDIYKYLIDKYNINPSKSVFFDDKEENIEAAKEVGLNGYVFNYENYDYILQTYTGLSESNIIEESVLNDRGSYILLDEYVDPNTIDYLDDDNTYPTIDMCIRLEQNYGKDMYCYSFDRNTYVTEYVGKIHVSESIDNKYSAEWIENPNSIDSITEAAINEDYTNFVNEEAVYDSKHKNPVYIILMAGNSILSYAIRGVTKSDYTHCAISFDSSLKPFYSFGMKECLQLRDMGFAILSPQVKEYRNNKIKFSVYVMFVTDAQKKKMIERLKWFIDKEAFLGYDFIGLIKYIFNRSSDRNLEKWFCSRFVMEVLGQGIKISRDASLYSPQQVKDELTNISLVNHGNDFYHYDKRITDKNVRDIKNGRYNYNEE